MYYVFIINPTSGNNKGIEVSKVIQEYCKLNKINYRIIYTSNKNDAKFIAKSYKDYKDIIIFSVGGDGTLNEVINGIANSKAKLGVIPVGTGNDFYRTFKDYNGDKIDLGKVNDRYFINVASLGLDAEIANYANMLKSGKLSKKNAYILSLIHEYLLFKPINLDVNGLNKESTILTVCNAKYYGGGFKIAPKAELNDGMFDIIDVKSLNKLKILNIIIKLLQEKHLESTNVDFYRSNSLIVNSLIPLNCNIDGEIIKDYSFNFSICEGAINVDTKSSKQITNLLKEKRLIR